MMPNRGYSMSISNYYRSVGIAENFITHTEQIGFFINPENNINHCGISALTLIYCECKKINGSVTTKISFP